jgi:uncharacterized membrane protein YfcA
MQPAVLMWLAIICVVAGMAKGLTGFGAALIMAPLFTLLVSPIEATALVVLLHALTGWQGVRRWRSGVNWRRVLCLAGLALLWHQIAMLGLGQIDDALVQKVIAVLVITLGLTGLIGLQIRNVGGAVATFIAGMVSGIFTAFGGLGGPPVAYYFAGQAQSHTAMRGNLLAYFAILFCGATASMALHGSINQESFWTSVILIPFFCIGMAIGSRLFAKVQPHSYKRVIQYGLIGIGVFALVR